MPTVQNATAVLQADIFYDGDQVLDRLASALGPAWEVIDYRDDERVDINPAILNAEVAARSTLPLVPQLVMGLRRFAAFYEATAQFLEDHVAEITDGPGSRRGQSSKRPTKVNHKG